MSDTKIMPAVGAHGGRRRRSPAPGSGLRLLVRDFLIIITTWAVTAYPILWVCSHVIGPALFGGTP